MKTTIATTTAASPRNTLKVRTAVRAGYSLGATQTGSRHVTSPATGYAMAEMGV